MEAIPTESDFVYIDAPYVQNSGKRRNTFTGKPAYSDGVRLLDAGGLPKVIMVDGRTDTVDLLLAHPKSSHYQFSGKFSWAMERGKFFHAVRLNRHSTFKLTHP